MMKFFQYSLMLLFVAIFASSCKTDLSSPQEDVTLIRWSGGCFFEDQCLIDANPLIKPPTQRTIGKHLDDETIATFNSDVKAFFEANPDHRKNLEKKYGIPGWSFIHVVEHEGSPLAFLPFAFPSSEKTEAVLVVFQQNSQLKFHLIDRSKFTKYARKKKHKEDQKEMSIEMAAIQFLFFDQELFDMTDCALVEIAKELFPVLGPEEKDVVCNWTLFAQETDWYVNGEYVDTTVEYSWEYVCEGSPDSGGSGGSSSGGSSGDSGTNTDPDVIDITDPGLGEICPSTFELVRDGDGFTTEVHSIKFSMYHTGTYAELYVPVGTLCIQVRRQKADGSYVTEIPAAKMIAYSWHTAQNYIQKKFKFNSTTYTASQARNDFISRFRSMLKNEFGGYPTVSAGGCSGDIPSNKPNYSVFCWN